MSSADYDFSSTRNELIQAAFEDCGVLGEGDTLSDVKMQYANKRLNWMLSSWQAMGIGLWKQETATIFPQPGQNKYELGSSSADHIAREWFSTTISADEAAGQTVLSIASNENMSNGMLIGIELDDGTRQWTTISSSTSTTVTVGAALTDTAASGNTVVFYTTAQALDATPLRIMQASRRNLTTNSDVIVELTRKADYFRIVQKSSTGTVTTAYYDKQIVNGQFYVWLTPNDCQTVININYRHPLQDWENPNQSAPLPAGWIKCVKLGLQKEICKTYGRYAELEKIEAEADALLEVFKMYDNEDGPIQICPDPRSFY